MSMDMDLAVRTLQALAAFQPKATTTDMPQVIAELHAALDQLSTLTTYKQTKGQSQ